MNYRAYGTVFIQVEDEEFLVTIDASGKPLDIGDVVKLNDEDFLVKAKTEKSFCGLMYPLFELVKTEQNTNSFNIDEYEKFVLSMKLYPEQHVIVYPTLGLTGEAGEFAEKVKKWLRGDKELDKAECIKELGDVLFYITAAANDLGYTLQDVIDSNVEKLSSRRARGVVKGNGDNR